VFADAHLHLVDLEREEPSFLANPLPAPDRLESSRQGWTACVVAHGRTEFARSQQLRAFLPPTIACFGIHPQNPVMDDADFLASLAASGFIQCVGEAGFDFFGDRPGLIRDADNLRVQRRAFEFQVELAASRSLPLVVHARRAIDILLGYGRRLARIPAVIFHCWPGRATEATEFLRKGVNAYFSFGTPLLRGGPRSYGSCVSLPAERILSETDAPWQPPHGEHHTNLSHIGTVVHKIASLRGMDRSAAELLLAENFGKAFGTAPQA
jgi:TatD DNase family protein